MAKATVVSRVLRDDRLECRVESPHGKETLTLTGSVSDVEPGVEGTDSYASNQALINNSWAFAKFTHLTVTLPTAEDQRSARKRAEAYRDVVEWLADLADDEVIGTKKAWCSGCFSNVDHRKLERPLGHLAAYLCSNCGSPSLLCADPRCENMAERSRGAVRIPRYCAEHRHEIPGFEKAGDRMDTLGDYREFLEYAKPNLSRSTKLVGGGLAALALAAPAALAAAPAVGGAVGTLLGGYSGAAASSYGLALLGGGSVASGGLGMLGGTVVVTALGGTLGGALGASVAHAYVREDRSFHIEMLRGGPGTPVVVCNGFLSEGGTGWGEWKRLVTDRYPDSPVYRVHWGAEELKDLGILALSTSLKTAGASTIKTAALKATQGAAIKLGPLSPLLAAHGLAKNPWHVAKSRADKTGVIVADLIARSRENAYVLVGHSLGARVMAVTAQALGSKSDGPRLEAVHLTGAAIGARSDWTMLTERVDRAVYNYHSANDKVLKYLYGVATGGQKAAGLVGFSPAVPKLENIDVTETIASHADYYADLTLR